MNDTRSRLLDGALETLRTKGIAGVSARTIAAAAGVNQALVFYHFGSVDDLLAAACTYGARQRLAVYAASLDAVSSLPELLRVGLELHLQERRDGNVIVLAQMLAGAQSEPRLVPATAQALDLWIGGIETVLRRVLAQSPLGEILDIGGLARSITSAFIGFELYDGVDPAGAGQAMAAIGQLGTLVDVVEELGPAARRVVRARLRRAAARARPPRAGPPRAEPPRAEPPRAELPRAELPRAELPRAEPPAGKG
jgi:AcrR family transcriptional regulator